MQDTPDTTSAVLYTETVTEYTTVMLAEQTFPASSLSLHNTAARSSFYSIQRGSPRSSRPPLHRSSTSPPQYTTPTPTSATSEHSTLMTIAKRSSYPRPSPPLFLFPDPIVPAAASSLARTDPRSKMSNGSDIWYPCYSPQIIVLAILTLGLAWAGISLVNTFWPSEQQAKKERRPLDKPSKYVCNQESAVENTSQQLPTTYLHDKSRVAWDDGGMEMKYRPRRGVQRTLTSQQTPTRGTASQPLLSAHSTSRSASTPPSTSPLPSPVNTFLSPPNHSHPRTSSPYLAPHTSSSLAPPSSAHPHSPTPTYDLATSEIEALEAGTAPLTPRTIKSHERKKSWVDLGLAAVEDTVNGMVSKVARWTDEGDESVILPISNGNGDRDWTREVEVR